jgi:hypothetical protein
MSEKKSTKAVERKLVPGEPTIPKEKVLARMDLLATLYALALEGNVSAAKLYFDIAEKNLDEEDALTTDEALKLINENKANSQNEVVGEG